MLFINALLGGQPENEIVYSRAISHFGEKRNMSPFLVSLICSSICTSTRILLPQLNRHALKQRIIAGNNCENIPLLLLALCVRFIGTFVDPGKKRHRCFSEISKSVEFPAEDKQTSTYPTYLDRAVGKSNTGLDQQADGSHCWRLDFELLKTISIVFRNCNHCIVVG